MALCKQGTLHLLPLPGFHRLDNSCGTEMNVFNPEDDVLKTSPHRNKCTVTRQTVFLLQAYPSSSRDDSLVLLAPVPKYFQGQSSHVLAGEEKQLMKMKAMYFLQRTVMRKAPTTPFHTMLYRSKEKGKKRHNSGTMHWKNQEIQ